jgi:hypothetical protein
VRRSPDLTSIVCGIALIAFGGVLLADAVNAIDLTFEWFGPLVCGTVGAVLLATGLSRER